MERFLGVPLDTKAIPQAVLNIAAKERSNLFPWNGQFSPQLVETLLTSFAKETTTILDPFAGSGTVIHEAAKLSKEVFGFDINPAAVKMAQAYRLMQLSDQDRRQIAGWVDDRLADALPDRTSLFGHGNGEVVGDVKDALLSILGEVAGEWERVVIEALIVLLDFHKECTIEKVNKTWRRLRSTVLNFEYASRPVHVFNRDARKLPFADGSVDFVLTSPPYINVFNYHQQYRRSAEAMGWNLLEVARAEIGSNRKHRGNRLLTVIQYCLDLDQVFHEMARVCQDGTRAIVVVGRESNVRKTRFFNGEIVANLAVRSLGWSFLMRQERAFINRFGNNIFEDILHFAIRKPTPAIRTEPREIAREVLIEARTRVPDEARTDLEEALSRVTDMEPSPLFDLAAASSQCRWWTLRSELSLIARHRNAMHLLEY